MEKLFKFVLVAIVTTMSVVSCNKNNADKTPATPAKYTIMLYGCGGANVDTQLEDALEETVRSLGVKNNHVNYTVFYSMSATDKDFQPAYRGEKGKTYRYVMSKDMDLTKEGYRSKYFYKNASEVELYKSSTLADFIRWSMENAPAENYILEPVNHGGGFDLGTEVLTKGIAYDDNHKVNGEAKGVAIVTIADALKEVGVHLKAIYWYGCLMGQLEVLTEVAPYCDYQFTSSHVAYTNTAHVWGLVDAINANPDYFENAILAHKSCLEGKGKEDNNSFLYDFAHATDAKTKQVIPVNGDFGCWRSNKVAAINEQVKKLGALLTELYPTAGNKLSIDTATSWVYLYEMEYGYADVLDYAQKLADYLEGDAKTRAQAIAADMKKAIDDACVYRLNAVYLTDAKGQSVTTKAGTFSLGISLYAGKRPDDSQYTTYKANYKASAFDKAVGWSKWMDINEFRVTIDDEHPNDTNPGNDTSWKLFWLEEE